MELYYNNGTVAVNYTAGIIVTIIALILLMLFYLYKKQNSIIMKLIISQYKPPPAELKKDTSKQDWLLLIIIFVFIFLLGAKLIAPIVVVSNSMKPEFERGDIILTQSINRTPSPGDIITFHVEDELNTISHRVVSINNRGIITTKGDNNPYKDDYETKQKDIIAKAIIFNNHPIAIKGLGALFIADFQREGVIGKFGDRFTFMQQLSAAIRTWGYILTIISILSYIILMKKH